MTTSVQRTRWRRTADRCLVLIAVAALGLAAVGAVPRPAQAQNDAGPRPDVFRSSASSLVAEISVDRDALLPIPEVLRFMAVEGRGTYETSNQTAQASLFYPGNGVIAGPNLLCDTFGAQFPPEFQPVLDACLGFDYPLTVRADSFLEPEGVSEGAVHLGSPGDPVSAQGVRAAATATSEATVTESALASLRVVGLPVIGPLDGLLADLLSPADPSVVTIDGATSRTRQRIDDEGTLVVEARSTLGGIRLVGGLVEIGSVKATAIITDDGRGTVTHDADLEIGGVTVAGLPARISADGLELGEPTGALGLLGEQVAELVNGLVEGLGINVTALEVADGVNEHGSAFARVGGLLVEFDFDVQGLPTLPGPMGEIDLSGLYRGSVLLGQAGAVGQAAYIDAPPFEPGTPVPPPDGAEESVPALTPPTRGAAPPPASATGPAGGDAMAPIAPERIRVTSFEHLVEGRLRLVYLAFAVAALGLAIAPRFTFSARLPGVSR